MNNIFDFKRFGNYFLYDLRNAKNNYGLNLLILGTLPISVFIVFELFSLIFTQSFSDLALGVKIAQLTIATTVILLGAGAKIYGLITEKRAGSNFLMVPASCFEKWLSLGLITCIVLPIIFLVLQFCSDALMSLIFPVTYGKRFFDLAPLQEIKDGLAEVGAGVNAPALLFMEWCQSILFFTLGAVCFKKNKVAKTLLCLVGLSFVFSTIGMIFITSNGQTYIESWLERFEDPDVSTVVRRVNWIANISYTLIIGGLLGGIYYRIRTLKH